MAADARWLKVQSFWQGLTRDKRDRVLGLLFIIAVAFIWVCISKGIPSVRNTTPFAMFRINLTFLSACILALQVLASFLVQDLEAEGLNPFLLTYIANSLFIVYLPIYVLMKRLTQRQKGRQVALHSVLTFLCCACHTC